MFSPYFALAAVSPGRQRAFRSAVLLHLAVVTGGAWLLAVPDPRAAAPWVGHLLLITGIVEGAALVGWRLTQLPRSQALEFLLVSPLRPHWVFAAEALVGLARLALVTLSGLPVLAVLTVAGALDHVSLLLVLVMPFTWGAVTGLTLTVWAYESRGVRRWAERGMLLVILTYLAVGVLAGEHLQDWLRGLPVPWQRAVLDAVLGFHAYNPFGILAAWLRGDPWVAQEWTAGLELAALAAVGLLGVRGACRLQGHFQERHYRPALDRSARPRPAVGDRPLSWWAVKRVSEYSGGSTSGWRGASGCYTPCTRWRGRTGRRGWGGRSSRWPTAPAASRRWPRLSSCWRRCPRRSSTGCGIQAPRTVAGGWNCCC
jgi:hypothetical protein